LENFYNSLTDRGSLVWNLTNLCGQAEIVCDNTLTPNRVTQLYHLSFIFTDVLKIFLNQNRNLGNKTIVGTIPTEFGDFVYLRVL